MTGCLSIPFTLVCLFATGNVIIIVLNIYGAGSCYSTPRNNRCRYSEKKNLCIGTEGNHLHLYFFLHQVILQHVRLICDHVSSKT